MTDTDYLDRQLNPLKVGDSVRLKDSPYQGKVTSMGMTCDMYKIVFKSTLGPHIAVTDSTVIERVLDPQAGDIYKDINDNEWVVYEGREHRMGETYLYARLTILRPDNYTTNNAFLSHPDDLERWNLLYEPKLVRRREQ